MNIYKSTGDIKSILSQIDFKLSNVEVKGNSVHELFSARLMLKEMFENIELEKEEEKEE